MEVHHHSHHPKKWKEYVTEFLMLFLAVSMGFVWNTRATNPTPQTLFGVGLGAQYQPYKNLSFRIDFGIPLVNANNPGSNLQDSGIYFTVNGNF